MTSSAMREWLTEQGIEFKEYQTTEEYIHRDPENFLQKHIHSLTPTHTEYHRNVSFSITGNNGKKNLALHFDLYEGKDCFENLEFGEADTFLDKMALKDIGKEQDDEYDNALFAHIRSILNADIKIIYCTNMDDGEWESEEVFDISVPKEERSLKRSLEDIHRKERRRLFGDPLPRLKYEIYDWNSFECIQKVNGIAERIE